ncbi:amidohydrolase family protein [Tomitella fengzijianii]|uniref:Amidohydrolase n=1 Tax=Tomitella fengzijianii TaxID=2597660 RepID=A0A516X6S9_9ACTN|nr:amidohydrolase family protein [Tomitella fengzijianii]QDQ98778.1 amidohydrolase [Tomitella fengzijianii]
MTTAPEDLDPALFAPEPEQQDSRYTIISVDDHVVEPPHLFSTWMPAGLRDRGPKMVENGTGAQVWEFDGDIYSQVGMNAVAGRRKETVKYEPFRFDQMRPGCYDIHARVKDMDLGGIWAMLNFPSQITGFCGRVFAFAKDREVGIAATRAWNDWLYNEWYLEYPERVIPGGITYLTDPVEAVKEIHRNAERGFTSVTFPERPHAIGLPSLWDRDHWDPIIRACVETDTVVSLHVGSSGMYSYPKGAPGLQLGATMFGQLSLGACSEWLWSGYPKDNPTLKIAMSEGGIGWVPMLIDRLDNIIDRSGYGLGWDERPADILRRNFWFCTLDDPSTIALRDVIGVENIMLETDYPHGDGTWPRTQDVLDRYWAGIPARELRMMCSENAAKLYRHPLPATVLPRDEQER